MDIAGTTALVAGGASGLGLATARTLAEAGAGVVILDLPTSSGAAAAERIGARFVAGDVTDADAVSTALDAAAESGPLRVAVACAGIGTAARVLGRDGVHPLDTFARIITINLVGTFNVVRLAAERMAAAAPLAGERGVIVTTASAAAFDGQIGQAAYAASKSGVAGMTLPIARDLADRLIRVVAIAPGLFDTPLLATVPERARRSLSRQAPHPSRLGRPEEFAALVAHVVSNPMLNGEVIRLDGAIRLPPR
ncbi:SDR family NAD(P)-dependent oxidoreductase [Spongiactinospora sp. 9N601]|uniref:SDR family NAD(P)-dependent oxidoreductase n=1 Tax=Spongiactinospora sp. 9N601 TaxID=3375149 RepID=UPI0037A1730E